MDLLDASTPRQPVSPSEPSEQPQQQDSLCAGRGEEEGYLVSQPGAVVPFHWEALSISSQVSQGVLWGEGTGQGQG